MNERRFDVRWLVHGPFSVAARSLIAAASWVVCHVVFAGEASTNSAQPLSQMDLPAQAAELVRHAGLGDASMVKALMEAGVPPGAPEPRHQQTALIVAASQGHGHLIRLLLQSGAAVNAQDRRGVTALVAASAAGHLDVVQRLLAAGADPSIQPREASTALGMAARKGHLRVVETLLRAGAKPDDVDAFGFTALDAARLARRTETLQKLVEATGGGQK